MYVEKKYTMIKYTFLSLITFLIFSISNLQAQQQDGYVLIHQDAAIDNLLKKHIQVNEYNPWISGYRVQLFSVSGVNSRDKANLFKAQILSKYPKSKVYIVYQEPYYKVRLGDFRTKINALDFLNSISKYYPSGFVVVDQIRFKAVEEEEQEENTEATDE